MNKLFNVVSFGILISAWGCVAQSESAASNAEYELAAEYAAGDAHLKVIGHGDWASPDVDIVFAYGHGIYVDKIIVNFAQWSLSGDPSVSEFFAKMDHELLESTLAELQEMPDQGTSEQIAFRHIQLRLMTSHVSRDHSHDHSALNPDVASAAEEKCYCSYCKVHHAPHCLSD